MSQIKIKSIKKKVNVRKPIKLLKQRKLCPLGRVTFRIQSNICDRALWKNNAPGYRLGQDIEKQCPVNVGSKLTVYSTVCL